MCGIVGFSGKKNYNIDILKFLLFWNAEERNSKDATGIFTPKSGIVKDNIAAKLFINNKTLTSKISLDKTLVGHVRAKTIGTNLVKNAHPFEYDDIVMVHNGTLENHLALTRMYELKFSEYDVDSQVLAKCISINTIHDDKIKVLEQFEGAAAIVYYNKNRECLYAFHDKNRPLFYGYINETEMYVSSIKESLEAVGCTGVTEFKVNHLYEIKEGVILNITEYFVSDKSNMIEVIRADAKDMSTKTKKGELIHRCKKPRITGFDHTSFKIGYARGFWILCDTTGYSKDNNELNKKHELLNYGQWYFVLGQATGSAYTKSSTLYIELQNEDGESGIVCTTAKLCIHTFIPQKGKYVKAMCNLVFHGGNRDKIADEGDVMLVKDYEYGDKVITIYNSKTNKTGVVPKHLVRIALNDEVKKHLEEQYIQDKIDFSNVNSSVEQPALPTKKTEGDLFTTDAKKLLSPKKKKSYSNVEDLSYSYQTVCTIILSAQQALQDIKNEFALYDYSKAEELVTDLDQELELLYDPEILEGMSPYSKEDEDEQEEYSEHTEDMGC